MAVRRSGSVTATVREFENKGWSFPVRATNGPQPGDLQWAPLTRNRANSVLRNPRYAGGYAYGQHRHRHKADGTGRCVEQVPREQWYKLDCHAHPGYLSWEEHEENLKRLLENAPRPRTDGPGAPREGPALLQGLAYCGLYGGRLGVRYHLRGDKLVPDYVCDRSGAGSNRAQPLCQSMSGRALDEALGKVLIEVVTPAKLELAIAVQKEIDAQAAECDRLRHMQVERARYQAGLAERRYKRVDPDNRLVAGTLEAEWNGTLRLLGEAQQEYERLRVASGKITAEAHQRILQMADDFPRIWHDPGTPDRERKRMARLLLEDVTVVRDQAQITARIRFKGGATQTLQVPVAQRTDPQAVARVDSLLQADRTYAQIALTLNQLGMRTARGKNYNAQTVRGIVVRHLPGRLAIGSTADPGITPPGPDHATLGEFGGAV